VKRKWFFNICCFHIWIGVHPSILPWEKLVVQKYQVWCTYSKIWTHCKGW
jgi:hypothetical protein